MPTLSGMGYATLQDVEDFLDITLAGQEARVVTSFIKTAEGLVTLVTAGRLFLPTNARTFGETSAGATELMSRDPATVRYPKAGLLYVDGELISYAGINEVPSLTEPTTYIFEDCQRGRHSSTAAIHPEGAGIYLVMQFRGQDTSLFLPDLLRCVQVWQGHPQWSPIAADTYTLEPLESHRKLWLRMGKGFSDSSIVQVAGIWGYDYEVPGPVRRAVLRLVEEMWLRRGTLGTEVKRETVEGHTLEFTDAGQIPRDVAELLRNYRRIGV